MCSEPNPCFAEEFVAHGADVNCLALGHKSGRVMVTGGDDKKVNMWAVGKPNCILVGGATGTHPKIIICVKRHALNGGR